jgi:hypothetical protein
MRAIVLALAFASAASCTNAPAAIIPPGELVVTEYVAPTPLHLAATTVREFKASEADQGVAVDASHFYPIDNTVIAKYERATGRLVARWSGPKDGLLRHLNSCFADGGKLWCAHSNYSLTPHGSSVEVFDANTMTHQDTHSLGMTDEGSLTWFDHYKGGWIAGFAHYTENGGVKFKDHAFSSVVTFDSDWRRTGGWLFPHPVIDRMAPHAASGGAIGPDGLLYVLGHDRPEMYVLARPAMGPTLLHVATIDLEAEGQAFSFAEGRTIFAIDRRRGRVLQIAIPPVPIDHVPDARPFR